MDINEARKALEANLREDQIQEYYSYLKQWLEFSTPISRDEFDSNARKLLENTQVKYHSQFMHAILGKMCRNRVKSPRNSTDGGMAYECEYSDYIQPSSPTLLPSDLEYRSAAAELFMPDSGFISSRIAVSAWENGMDGAEENVTDVIVNACQMFIKNIITAMLTKKKGYKIKSGKFQYGFNQPIADPFLRNYANVTDSTSESKVAVADDDDTFIPNFKESYDNVEQQVAFAYSCSKRKKTDNTLTVKLLYDTLNENPKLLGLHSIQSVNLLKLGLNLDE